MEVKEAIDFLAGAISKTAQPSVWADLGCGKGLFTRALAGYLAPGSRVIAVDQSQNKIASDAVPNRDIRFIRADFTRDPMQLPPLDGILMANSLHYVKEKEPFIQQLKTWLKNDGQLLLIEYDTETSNRWVPFPITYRNLDKTFRKQGFGNIEKIRERASVFGAPMYLACLRRLPADKF